MRRFEEDPSGHGRETGRPPRRPPAEAPLSPAVGQLGSSELGRLQRAVGNRAVVQLLSEDEAEPELAGGVIDAVTAPGAPLEAGIQREMSGRLGADFSGVRVHTGPAASASADSLGARAYTLGEDVVFAESAYAPATGEGRRTLAHELTHVVQQRNGPVEGSDTGGGVAVSDPADRFEQEAAAVAEAEGGA